MLCAHVPPVQPTAQSAIRNLKGREFMNRKLNVDYASDKQRADAQRSGPDAKNGGSLLRPGPAGRQGMGGDQSSGPALHGQEAPAGQAATSIAKTIASMPPQQMFELMKDIKVRRLPSRVPLPWQRDNEAVCAARRPCRARLSATWLFCASFAALCWVPDWHVRPSGPRCHRVWSPANGRRRGSC